MFGAIYGDVIGSYYEVHCTKDEYFDFHKDSSFTDDSVLTAAVCKTILSCPDDITFWELNRRSFEYAVQYKAYYHQYPHAGFGNLFRQWAENKTLYKQKSYGNGAAMRTVPIGYAYDNLKQVLLQAKASCLYTHNSREAIVGAECVAAAVWLARHCQSKSEIQTFCEKKFGFSFAVPIEDIRKTHVFDSRTKYSVPPAIIAFLQSDDYESAVRNAVSLGGDADTQACIAGGIAEAYYREIPKPIRSFCDSKIDIGILSVIREFERQYPIKK